MERPTINGSTDTMRTMALQPRIHKSPESQSRDLNTVVIIFEASMFEIQNVDCVLELTEVDWLSRVIGWKVIYANENYRCRIGKPTLIFGYIPKRDSTQRERERERERSKG
jgi:hypothetical protein